jgi:hypothetical protein
MRLASPSTSPPRYAAVGIFLDKNGAEAANQVDIKP